MNYFIPKVHRTVTEHTLKLAITIYLGTGNFSRGLAMVACLVGSRDRKETVWLAGGPAE